MKKIQLEELNIEYQNLIKTRVKLFLYDAWVEEDTHFDEEEGVELTSGYYQVHAKMKTWARILLILFSPFISIISALKVAVTTFIEDMKSLLEPAKPFSVFRFRKNN